MHGSKFGGAITPDQLRETYKLMIDYGDTPASDVELMETLEDWPGKQPADLGWAYVAMSEDGYSEAIAVVVAQESDKPAIRQIEWGRP